MNELWIAAIACLVIVAGAALPLLRDRRRPHTGPAADADPRYREGKTP